MDQYLHIGEQVPLGLARAATDELLANPAAVNDGGLPPIPGVPSAADNDASLASLTSALGGLSG